MAIIGYSFFCQPRCFAKVIARIRITRAGISSHRFVTANVLVRPVSRRHMSLFFGARGFFLMLLILYSPFSRSTPKSFAFLVTGDSSISYGSTLAVRLTHVEECSQAEFFPANKVVRRHDFVVSFPGSVLGAI